jgi:hypothetical protein
LQVLGGAPYYNWLGNHPYQTSWDGWSFLGALSMLGLQKWDCRSMPDDGYPRFFNDQAASIRTVRH